jgi:hypothetical protein
MDDPEWPSKARARRKRPPALNPERTADYIRDMALELSKLADEAGLSFLKHLIDMVAYEAKRESGTPRRRSIVREQKAPAVRPGLHCSSLGRECRRVQMT